MVYRFKLVSDEVSNFVREIEIDSEHSFLQLRNAILDSVGFSHDELDSFFICDEDWNKEEEITLEDMGVTASDRDLWLMESTPLEELIEEEGQKLIFVFDYLTERSFFMELKEIIPERDLDSPVCTMRKGSGPKQSVDLTEFENQIDVKAASSVEFEDDDIISGGSFNEDEIGEGYDIMDFN